METQYCPKCGKTKMQGFISGRDEYMKQFCLCQKIQIHLSQGAFEICQTEKKSKGCGNYTEERHKWLDNKSIKDLTQKRLKI